MPHIRYSFRNALAFLLVPWFVACSTSHNDIPREARDTSGDGAPLPNQINVICDSSRLEVLALSGLQDIFPYSKINVGGIQDSVAFTIAITKMGNQSILRHSERSCAISYPALKTKVIKDSLCELYAQYMQSLIEPTKSVDSLRDMIAAEAGVYIPILPENYQIKQVGNGFVWVKCTYKTERQVLAASRDALDSATFSYQLLADLHLVLFRFPFVGHLDSSKFKSLRDSLVAAQWVHELDSSRHMVTIGVTSYNTDMITIDGRKTISVQGDWHIQDGLGAGEFLAHGIMIPHQEELIYMEGFVNAPDQDKKRFFHELNTIMGSSKILEK